MDTVRGTRSFWLLQVAGWGFYGLATFLTFLTTVEPDRWAGLFAFKAVVRPAAGIVVSSALALAYRGLDRDDRRGGTIAAAAGAGSAVGGVAWYLLAMVGVRALWGGEGPLVDPENVPHGFLEYVFVMLAWSAAFFGIRAWRRARERERHALAAEARANEARLRMLTGQLNPHFLFNALSSLRGLVRRDPERAERTVTRLAAFLRSALVQPGRESVPLREEMETIEAYLDVERARLGDGLDVRTDVAPEAADRAIPPFLLHPLVENAVKHAERGAEGRTRVEVRARVANGRLEVEVANPGALDGGNGPGAPPGTGTGLGNVRERLARLYPGRHAFALVEEDGWVRARLALEEGDGGEPAP